MVVEPGARLGSPSLSGGSARCVGKYAQQTPEVRAESIFDWIVFFYEEKGIS